MSGGARYFTTVTLESPIGPLTVVLDDEGNLTRLSFGGAAAASFIVERRPSGRRGLRKTGGLKAAAPPFERSGRRSTEQGVAEQLREYFAGKRQTFDIPLALRGTEFQLAVWNELLRVPYGDTITYAELAQRIGRPSAIRAVGAANGANPIPVIVPCHRVIGSNGTLTGYGGGIERKQWLLAHEGRRLF